MSGIKLEANLEVKLGVGNKTGGQKFCIGLPKMHGRIRIGLPKVHGRIRIGFPKVHGRFHVGPPQVSHAISLYWISPVQEFRSTIAIMKENH